MVTCKKEAVVTFASFRINILSVRTKSYGTFIIMKSNFVNKLVEKLGEDITQHKLKTTR